MEENPNLYTPARGFRDVGGIVYSRDFPCFHASGGVDYVWLDLLKSKVYFGVTDPADGMSVRFRYG